MGTKSLFLDYLFKEPCKSLLFSFLRLPSLTMQIPPLQLLETVPFRNLTNLSFSGFEAIFIEPDIFPIFSFLNCLFNGHEKFLQFSFWRLSLQ
jgi:hypothetical protein